MEGQPRTLSGLLKWRGRSPVERAAATLQRELRRDSAKQACPANANLAAIRAIGSEVRKLPSLPACRVRKPAKICLANHYDSVIMRRIYDKNVTFLWGPPAMVGSVDCMHRLYISDR